MSREGTCYRCVHFPCCPNANSIQIPQEHRIPVGSTVCVSLQDSKGVQSKHITSMTNSPEKPCFPFEPELALNIVRRQSCSKKLQQPRNPNIRYFPILANQVS